MDNAENAEQAVARKKTKKDKVRSAWISFAGRIVAQLVGAIATVALGVMVLHRYTSDDTRPPATELSHDGFAPTGHPNATIALGTQPAASGAPGQPPVYIIVITPGMLGLREDARIGHTDRSCAPTIDNPSTSAAHLSNETLLSR